jgi:hypothetical protein
MQLRGIDRHYSRSEFDEIKIGLRGIYVGLGVIHVFFSEHTRPVATHASPKPLPNFSELAKIPRGPNSATF